MVNTKDKVFFMYNANSMTVNELKNYSKKLLYNKDYERIQTLKNKSKIIDDIVLSMFDMRYNTPLRLKHDYITRDVISDTEGLDHISDVDILDNTRMVRIIDGKPYFYLGSVNYFVGKNLAKAIKKYYENIFARSFYRYLIGGYDIYVSRKDRYVPYK